MIYIAFSRNVYKMYGESFVEKYILFQSILYLNFIFSLNKVSVLLKMCIKFQCAIAERNVHHRQKEALKKQVKSRNRRRENERTAKKNLSPRHFLSRHQGVT